MAILERIEEYNVVKKSDVERVTKLIYSKIHINDLNKDRVDETDSVLSSFIALLESLLNLSSNTLSKKEKVEIIHILDNSKLQQEFIEISKKSQSDDQFLAKLKEASIHLGKKSQSAFETK